MIRATVRKPRGNTRNRTGRELKIIEMREHEGSINSRIKKMKVGEKLTFPLSKSDAISTARRRAMDHLAPETPDWKRVKNREKATITIWRIK